jgi:hypothetical protein
MRAFGERRALETHPSTFYAESGPDPPEIRGGEEFAYLLKTAISRA